MTKAYSSFTAADGAQVDSASLQAMLRDLEEARALQVHARPRSGQSVQDLRFDYSIQAARYLSGDALDFFCLPDGRVLAYLLDVSGQGTAAALLSMFIKSSVRHSMVMGPGNGPADVLRDVNRMLLDAGMHKYATMLCFIFAASGDSLEWSHAGHTPRPVLLNDGQASLLQGRGQPVGLFAEAEYQAHTLALRADFALCLCSDGVLTALAGDNLVEREADLVRRVQELNGDFGALQQALGVQANEGNGVDDRSLLVVSRTSHD